MKTYDWIVVGGGIKGAALAYELRKTGFSVLLLEQETTPQNATRYSYGGLAYWSGSTPLTCKLLEEAIARYRILDQELDADTQFRELDLLLTIAANGDPDATAASYAHVGIPPQLISVQDACELEPLLNPQAIAGALTVKHGHIHPEKTTQAYIQAFLRLGGEMQITQVLEVIKQGVKTTTATYHAANTVICAGGLSRQLLQSSGIFMKVYFTHAEIIETLPTDIQLHTLVMPANLQRLQLEAQATQVDELWNQPGNETVSAVLDAGAIQFLDGSIRLGQISRILTDPHAKVNSELSEKWLRNSIAQVLPALGNLAGIWHHCLVEFTQTRLPLIGTIPGFENVHVFTGFSSPLAMVPSLAERFAKFAAGNQDEILVQLSPKANVF
ncbi:NAD(P)/FAD-dependent oxidoreductase [Nostoc sp. CCY0012]|uniref:NAD(P)/FAD-dependent oxidoreductase n=1 Tax=Nostoc sp. CCY0012 TaxID=1056123 RepID=UPI0039C73900